MYPYGPYAGESIPLHAAPPNLPLTGNGCVDILAIIQPHVTTKDRTKNVRLQDVLTPGAVALADKAGCIIGGTLFTLGETVATSRAHTAQPS